MIRVYCDSNIYRYLNPKHPSFNLGLLDVFESLKDKMLFTYSDAHLDDLKNSPKNYAESDLLLMGNYVKDNYFMHDLVEKKQTGPYLATPIEAFNNKNYDTYNEVLNNNPFDTDSLFAGLGDFEGGDLIKSLMKSFLDLPLMLAGNTLEPEKMTKEDREWFYKMSPNYKPTISIGDFMKDTWPYVHTLLKDKKEVAKLRRHIRSYLKSDDISFLNWGIEFNERLKSSPIGKSFIEMIEGMVTDNEKDNMYKKFNYYYTMLEMYNITEERTKNGIKKFNLESLSTDALHAWYASFSDYLVTNDKGLQIKASIVYNLLGFPTKVLSLSDFINQKSILLGQEETSERFSAAFIYDLKHSFQMYRTENLFNEETVTTYKTTHPYFNYFNRFQIIRSKESSLYVFYCERESHANFFMYREIELIVNKLIDMFGIDEDNKGGYDFNKAEGDDSSGIIRRWKNDRIKYTLMKSSKSWGNFLCLCLEIIE